MTTEPADLTDGRTGPPDARQAVLDTSCVVLLDRLTGLPDTWRFATASISYAELEWGLQRASGEKAARRRRQVTLARTALGAGLPFDDACAAAYGVLCAVTESAGRGPRGRAVDLLIAAVALRHGAVLVTANATDVVQLTGHLDVAEVGADGSFRGLVDGRLAHQD